MSNFISHTHSHIEKHIHPLVQLLHINIEAKKEQGVTKLQHLRDHLVYRTKLIKSVALPCGDLYAE